MHLSAAQKILVAKLGSRGLPRSALSAREWIDAVALNDIGAVIWHWKALNEGRWAATLEGLAAIGAEQEADEASACIACSPAPNTSTARDHFPARRGDWMQTYTGRRFWPLDPQPEDVCIEDIAHALSLTTRFGGHCISFYSVAEHCVHLARAAEPEHKLWLLLHDASEAYLNDMVRPLKRHMPEYREAEDRVSWAIFQHFGLDPANEPREVKLLDNRIIMDERAQNLRWTGEVWNYGGATEPLGVSLQFWPPPAAEAAFLDLFNALRETAG